LKLSELILQLHDIMLKEGNLDVKVREHARPAFGSDEPVLFQFNDMVLIS
jgi:hypothetical protein